MTREWVLTDTKHHLSITYLQALKELKYWYQSQNILNIYEWPFYFYVTTYFYKS